MMLLWVLFTGSHTRFNNQPYTVEFIWVELARQSSCCHDFVATQWWWISDQNSCHQSKDGSNVDMVVVDRRQFF